MKTNFLHIFFISILFVQCKKDDDTPQTDDSVEFNYPVYYGNSINEPADNNTTNAGVLLGRHLFYEPLLSQDSSISCSSCHQQSKAFTDGLDKSVGIYGQIVDRSSMSVCNMLWTTSNFWDGRAATLEEQALGPIQNSKEMALSLPNAVSRLQGTTKYPPLFQNAFGDATVTSDRIAKAIAQFERTIISCDSKYDQYLAGNYTPTADELEGIQLFFTHPEPSIGLRGGNCGDCHGNALTTLNGFHNIGLDSIYTDLGREGVTGLPADHGKFRAPTLRNIALTAPYMHDGRHSTLQDVLDHYNSHVKQSPTLDPLISNASNVLGGDTLALTAAEKTKIIAFLEMLTDSVFIANPAYSDPN